MNKIQLGIDAISTTPIRIGFEGENVHTQVTFFWTVLRSKYPDAVASLSIKPPVGDIYPKSVTQDGNKVVWDVTASDTANPGSGEYQLTFTDGEEIIKTYIGNFTVNDSIIGDGEAPDPIQDWVADANAVLGELSEISASVTTLEAGESATVEVTEVGGHKNLAFGIPAGEKGEQGEQGEPGDPAPAEEVIPAVNAYLAEVITNPDSPPLDRTLSSSSAAAPADMVGDLKSALVRNNMWTDGAFNKSRNLFNPDDYEKLVLKNNRTWDSLNGYRTTKLIPVSGQSTIVFNGVPLNQLNGNTEAFYVFEYTDENAEPTMQSTSALHIPTVYTPTQTTKYIRITYKTSPLSDGKYLYVAEGSALSLPTKYGVTVKDLFESVVTEGKNLLDLTKSLGYVEYANNSGYIDTREESQPSDGNYRSILVKVEANTKYTLSSDSTFDYYIYEYDSDFEQVNVISHASGQSNYVFTSNASANYWVLVIRRFNNMMLVKGETALPFEPFVNDGTLIEYIKDHNNPLLKKTVLFCGDSICYGYAYSGGYAGIIGSKNSMTVTNTGVSGASVCLKTNRTDSILEQLRSHTESFDYVILEGGINDGGSNTRPIGEISDGYSATLDEYTYCGAMEALCKELLTNHTESKVGFIFCHRVKGRTNQNSYFDKGVEACEKWSIPYLDLRKAISMNCNVQTVADTYTNDDDSDSTKDGLHPNEQGYKRFYAPKIEQFMRSLV